jgi:two-component system sensor histidine kinase VanS
VRTEVDLAPAAEDALDAAQAEIVARRPSVEADTESATVTGDRLLIEHLVANLVDSAVRHNVDDGAIEVRVVFPR